MLVEFRKQNIGSVDILRPGISFGKPINMLQLSTIPRAFHTQ